MFVSSACSLEPLQSGRPELQSMEGTLDRKHKLQLGGKKVRNAEGMTSKSEASQQSHSYLIFTGGLQSLGLLLRRPL